MTCASQSQPCLCSQVLVVRVSREEFKLKMAAQGGGIAFQEKVSRLLSRQDGKPVLKPNRRLALRDSVANRKLKKGGKNWVTPSQSHANTTKRKCCAAVRLLSFVPCGPIRIGVVQIFYVMATYVTLGCPCVQTTLVIHKN